VEAFRQKVAAEYLARTGLRPEIYVTSASDGARQVELGSSKAVTEAE
jgi:galactokinase